METPREVEVDDVRNERDFEIECVLRGEAFAKIDGFGSCDCCTCRFPDRHQDHTRSRCKSNSSPLEELWSLALHSSVYPR